MPGIAQWPAPSLNPASKQALLTAAAAHGMQPWPYHRVMALQLLPGGSSPMPRKATMAPTTASALSHGREDSPTGRFGGMATVSSNPPAAAGTVSSTSGGGSPYPLMSSRWMSSRRRAFMGAVVPGSEGAETASGF